MALTTFCTGKEFLERYDARLIGDIVSDNGTRVVAPELESHPKLIACIEDAHSRIFNAIVVGNRYTRAQIASFADEAVAALKRLNADYALILLKQRRGQFNEKTDGKLREECLAEIKAIKDGEVYLMDEAADHAAASTIGMAQPELIPVEKRQTIRFTSGQGYFPRYPYSANNRRIGNGGN